MVMSWMVESIWSSHAWVGAKQLLVVGQLWRVAKIYSFDDLRNVATDRAQLLRDGDKRLRIVGGKSRPTSSDARTSRRMRSDFPTPNRAPGRLDPREIV